MLLWNLGILLWACSAASAPHLLGGYPCRVHIAHHSTESLCTQIRLNTAVETPRPSIINKGTQPTAHVDTAGRTPPIGPAQTAKHCRHAHAAAHGHSHSVCMHTRAPPRLCGFDSALRHKISRMHGSQLTGQDRVSAQALHHDLPWQPTGALWQAAV